MTRIQSITNVSRIGYIEYGTDGKRPDDRVIKADFFRGVIRPSVNRDGYGVLGEGAGVRPCV
jgi:hypothetical protein